MDDFLTFFSDSKNTIDQTIGEISQSLAEKTAKSYGQAYSDVFAAYTSVLSRGGKRLRGILTKWSYQTFGGSDDEVSTKAAVIIEMIHAYLLVVDDVADRSETRRGRPAAHKLLEEYHRKNKLAGDSAHFGAMQAINAALAAQNTAFSMLTELDISSQAKISGISLLNEFLVKTDLGQIGDINNEAFSSQNKDDILQVLTLKTAYYTFLMPLSFGITLAGQDLSKADFLEPYALNLGLAFQIHDDIIGTFGDTAKTGKSSYDDLAEGKRTLLVLSALENSSSSQRQIINQALGNRKATAREFEAAKKAIIKSGALDQCRQLVKQYSASAKRSVLSYPSDSNNFGFLIKLTDYIAESE